MYRGVIKISSQIRRHFGRKRKVIIKRQRDFIPAQVTACFCKIIDQNQMLGFFLVWIFFFSVAVVINKSETHCRAPDGEES